MPQDSNPSYDLSSRGRHRARTRWGEGRNEGGEECCFGEREEVCVRRERVEEREGVKVERKGKEKWGGD